MSCRCNWTERVMCAHCCHAFHQVNCCFFFYENVYPMSSFYLKFYQSLDELATGIRYVIVSNHTSD